MANPYFEQAQQFQWQGRYPEALANYQRALQMEPSNGQIYYEMAITLTHLGMKAEAKAAVEKAKALDPSIAKTIEAQHTKSEAEKILRQAVDTGKLADAGPLLEAIRAGLLSASKVRDQLSTGAVFERSIAPQLMQALDDELHYVRSLAAEWVVRIGYKGAIPKLTGLLSDPVETVRIAAVKACSEYLDKSIIPMLESVAQNDTSRSARDAAREAVDYLTSIEVTTEQREDGWLTKATRVGPVSSTSIQKVLWE